MTSNAPLTFGYAGFHAYFPGLIDEVAIYKRALTAEEIRGMYNRAVLESQPPDTPRVIDAPAVTAATSLFLRGTKEANTSIWINGQKKSDLSADTAWNAQVDLNPGSNLLSIVARNADGIESSPLILPVILDNIAPVVTQKTPAEGALINQPNPTVSFKLQDTYSAVDLAATTSAATVTVNGEAVPGTWSTSGSDTIVFTPNPPPVGAPSDGAYIATIHPTDALGNNSLASLSFTIDSTPPPAPGIDRPAGPVPVDMTLTGTRGADAEAITVTSSSGSVGRVTYPSATTWQVALTGLAEGEATVSATATDAAGNLSESASITLVVDMTSPSAPSVAEFISPVAASSLVLSGSKEADTVLNLDGQELADISGATEWSIEVALSEGENTFTLFAQDAAGNRSDSITVTVVCDTTAPAISSSTPESGALATFAGVIVVTLSDSLSAVDLTASLTGAKVEIDGGTAVAGTWTLDGESLAFTSAAPFPDGSYTVTLAPVDTLGNTGSAAFSFIVDSSAPTVAALTMSPDSPHKAETVTFKVDFDEEMDTAVDPTISLARAAVLPSAAYLITGVNGAPPKVDDTFDGTNGTQPDALRWTGQAVGTMEIRNNQLYSAVTNGNNNLHGNWQIAGNFDIQVQFEKINLGANWYGVSGVIVGYAGGYLELYQGIVGSSEVVRGIIHKSDGSYLVDKVVYVSSGNIRFKVTRDANNVVHLFYSEAALLPFTELASAEIGSSNIGVNLSTRSYSSTAVAGYFDNFKVNSGTVVGFAGSSNTGSWVSSTSWQGAYTFTTATGDGDYTVIVSGARDLAGNTMAEQTVGSFVLDTAAPAAPTAAGAPSATVSTSLTLSGGKEADSALFINGQELPEVFAETAWSKSVSLAEGSNTFTLFAEDAASNRSEDVTVTVVRDTTAPLLSASTPSPSSLATAAGTVVVTLADSLSAVDLAASLTGATVKDGAGIEIAGSWAVVSDTLVFTPAAPLADSAYTVTLHPADTLGNTGTAAFGFTIDSSAPSVSSLVMSPDSPHKAETVSFTLAFSEAMNTAAQPEVVLRKDGLLFDTTDSLSGSWLNATTWRGSFAFTSSSGDGEYAVTVAGAKDVAGNVTAEQTVGSFVLDTVAPEAPTLDPVATPTRQATQILTGGKEAGTTLIINGQQKVPLNSETAWSVGYPLKEGANTLAIVARDAAGNDSPPAAATAILLDTTPPAFSVDVWQPLSSQPTQTISGACEPGSTVTLDGEVIVGPEDLSGTWSHEVTLVEGIATRLTFTASDALGNSVTRSVDVLYDALAPPALADGVLAAAGSGSGAAVRLSWPAYVEPADLAYYRIYVADADFTEITGRTAIGTADRGTRTYTVTGLTEGSTYFFAVEPVDVSGNSETAVHTASAVPVDTAAPEEVTALQAVSSYSGAEGNTVTLSWTASRNTRGDLADQTLYIDSGTGYDGGTSLGKDAVSRSVTGLADATLYKFKITTRDAGGHESAGTVVQAVTRLANPAGLAATAGKNQVALRWDAVSSAYLKEYRVYRLASTETLTEVAGLTPVRIQTGTTWTDTGLENGVTYRYAVTALNTSGAERTQVESVEATPRQDADGPAIGAFSLSEGQVLAAPITVEASAADAESGMDMVELYIDGVLVATGSGSSVSWYWNLVDSTDGNHQVKVVAFDALGNATEETRMVVVSLAPPATPQITAHSVAATVPAYTVGASGSAPLHTAVTLKVNGMVAGSIETSAAGSFAFSGLTMVEGENRLAVKAAHRGGDSPWSADYRITVDTGAPAAPTGLAAKSLAGGSVQFTWQAGAGETPTGYNLYVGSSPFTSITDAGVTKINSSPIGYQFREIIPADDAERHCAVTALDGAGNESPLSDPVAIASDRSAPQVAGVTFTPESGASPPDQIFGPGRVAVALTVSEPLKELPFFSLEPQVGSPVVVTLTKTDDLHYGGSFRVDATSPHGPTTWKFSGKDAIGNRANSQGAGPVLDVRGPAATVTEPSGLQQTAAAVPVAISFDEAPVDTPVLEFRDAAGTVVPVTGLVQSGDALHWEGTVDLSALAEGEGSFRLFSATDRFGNLSATVAGGGKLLLYKDAPPAPAVPQGLTAVAKAGGRIELLWKAVTGATSYRLYRRAEGESGFTLLAEQTATGFADTPDSDGSYTYAVSAVGQLSSESALSPEVTASSDRSAPAAPSGLALSLEGSGVRAIWSAPEGEAPASYKLYRYGSSFSAVAGLTVVATAATPEAVDAAPSSTLRHYAVTAVDGLGNESAPSPSVSIDFPVAPVKNLVLTQLEGGKPSLAWEAPQGGLQGYFIYRNGLKVNSSPTPGTSYTDGYYSGGTVSYGISALDAYGNESPVRELTLPDLSIALPEGTTLRRGLLETVPVVLTSSSGVNLKEIRLKVGSAAESLLPGPFVLASGEPLTVRKVAATPLDAGGTVAVVGTAVIEPAPGTTLRITRTSLAQVTPSGSALEIFNEPLIRGTNASVRLKVNNLGSARTEFLTSENGGTTAQVRVFLKDQDGNVLAEGRLDQRTGSQVVNSGGYATARIEPGDSLLSDPIVFRVPESAPYAVVLEAVIAGTYYHYKWPDQVSAPGMRQSLDATINEVSYSVTAAAEHDVYKQGEKVLITGHATSNITGDSMGSVPVRLGISVKGFDRFYTVTTDPAGDFSFTYDPGAGAAGTFSVWATHPDIEGRSVQDTFDVIGMRLNQSLINLTLAKGTYFDIPLRMKNLGNIPLTGLSIAVTASSGISADFIGGEQNTRDLAGGEDRPLTFRIGSTQTSPDTGFITATISTDEGLSAKVIVNVTLPGTYPVIRTSPSYIDAGMVRGTQRLEGFTISNVGLGNLNNARLEGPSTSWMSLTVNPEIGSLAVGQKVSVGVLLRPPASVPPGIYNDRIVIRSDNHIPFTFNIQVTVTSDAVGNVLFDVLNELYEDVAGASITLQHQSLPELFYTLRTGADGTVSIFDIPEGRYSYMVNATGHKSYGNSLNVQPGLTLTVPVALEVTLVQVEWSVTEIIIEDRYEIKIEQTFETNVPTAVIVVDPPAIVVPKMEPGGVFNGEVRITNHGLISAKFLGMEFPSAIGDVDLEVLNTIPDQLGANQTVVVPYRLTRREQ